MLAATAPSRALSAPLTDRLGIAASVLCAIHCAAAPVVLIAFPAAATWWSSPVFHVLGAVLVVPLALIGLHFACRRHHQLWPRRLGWAGSFFILLALLPWWAQVPPLIWNTANTPAITNVTDTCCPTITQTAQGTTISLPWSALLTIIGSLMLIIAHTANACCWRRLKHHPSHCDCHCNK